MESIKYLIYLSFFFTFSSWLECSWDQWWAYDGISGPDYWGLLNPKWSHCSRGRKQSPININPDYLLFDPGLGPLQMQGDLIEGTLTNTGRGFKLEVSSNTSLVISSGPLSYSYSIFQVAFHYSKEPSKGSEHTINGTPFSGEVQFYFYNSQLYLDWSQAAQVSNGLVAISVFIKLLEDSNLNQTNNQLSAILDAINHTVIKEAHFIISDLDLRQLLPSLEYYVTYEGSLTEPPCHETVQWILLNKPIYATFKQWSALINSSYTDGYANNFRPIQSTNYRCIRTNIWKQAINTGETQSKHTGTKSEDKRTQACDYKGYLKYKANVK